MTDIMKETKDYLENRNESKIKNINKKINKKYEKIQNLEDKINKLEEKRDNQYDDLYCLLTFLNEMKPGENYILPHYLSKNFGEYLSGEKKYECDCGNCDKCIIDKWTTNIDANWHKAVISLSCYPDNTFVGWLGHIDDIDVTGFKNINYDNEYCIAGCIADDIFKGYDSDGELYSKHVENKYENRCSNEYHFIRLLGFEPPRLPVEWLESRREKYEKNVFLISLKKLKTI